MFLDFCKQTKKKKKNTKLNAEFNDLLCKKRVTVEREIKTVQKWVQGKSVVKTLAQFPIN